MVLEVVGNAGNQVLEVPEQDEPPLPAPVALALVAVERVEHEPHLNHVLQGLELLTVRVRLNILIRSRDICLHHSQHPTVLDVAAQRHLDLPLVAGHSQD
jgi:hypothetical protein